MKKLTVTLDEETAAWASVHAARRGMSVSRPGVRLRTPRLG